MIIPIRCMNCGNPLADKWLFYQQKVKELRGSDKVEPIYMDGNPCVMEPGDIVIYRGCDLAHWRDPFNAPEDSWHIQAFFHYVDANGPYPEFKWDRRPMLGHRDPPKPDAIPVTTGKNYITYIK